MCCWWTIDRLNSLKLQFAARQKKISNTPNSQPGNST